MNEEDPLPEKKRFDYPISYIFDHYNWKTGAIAGALYGLGASILDPEIRQLPLEQLVLESSLSIFTFSVAASVTGIINQKYLNPLRRYSINKINHFFDSLEN